MESKDLQPIESSELPLADRESQPPLVVDLPDGQKLVVGNLDPGTVIEVATWRGTGRPDSRTNRFMLGVSSAEAEGIPAKRTLPQPDQISSAQASNQIPAAQISNNHIASNQSAATEFGDNKVATGVIYANVNPVSTKAELEKVGSSTNRFSKFKSKVGWLLAPILVAASAYIMVGPAGLKFAHPVAGASTSLGSANTSLVVVRQQDKYEVGQSVVSDLPSPKPSPVIGIVAAVSERAILISTDTGYVQIRTELLHGKVVAVLPFIGQIANLIGR